MEKYTYFENLDSKGNTTGISRSDGAWIPTDPANRDYQEYLASLEATEPEAE
jgi:hypothetical protein